MKRLYLRTHMGLGDMILCNAIVRNACKKFEKVITFVKPEYRESIFFMYRDIKNLEIIPIYEPEIDALLKNIASEEKYVVGFGNIEQLLKLYKFDECFYRQAGLNFQRRWNDFFVQRDLDAERRLLDGYQLNKGEYIFIHDDRGRGYTLSEKLLPSNITHFRPDGRERNIFNYCTIIENAKQVHVMDSCFKHIADSLPLKNELFYHTYVRSTSNNHVTNSKLNWHYYHAP